MDPFTIAFIASSAMSVFGGLQASKRQANAAMQNAYNVRTQRVMNDADAYQRSNDRYRQFKLAESANRALLGGAMGRDIGGADRSVAAFLERNRETAFRDLDRIESQRQMESLNLEMQSQSEIVRAGDIRQSGVINAFTSMATTMAQYHAIKMPSAPSPLAPQTSLIPTMRPA